MRRLRYRLPAGVGMGQGRVLGADAVSPRTGSTTSRPFRRGSARVGGDAEASARKRTPRGWRSHHGRSRFLASGMLRWISHRAGFDDPGQAELIRRAIVDRRNSSSDQGRIRTQSLNQKINEGRTFAEACRPSRCRTWIGPGVSYSVRTAEPPCRQLSGDLVRHQPRHTKKPCSAA